MTPAAALARQQASSRVLFARQDAAVLDGRRIEVEERQRLADQHLGRREVTPAEAIVGRQEIEVPVGLVNQLAAEALIEGLQPGLRVDEERVPVAVVAIDVPSTPQRQIDVGKRVGLDGVLKRGVGWAHGRLAALAEVGALGERPLFDDESFLDGHPRPLGPALGARHAGHRLRDASRGDEALGRGEAALPDAS